MSTNRNSTEERCRRATDNSKGYSAVLNPSTADLHWAAGFLEGEGSFQVAKYRNKFNQSVTAVQVESEPLAKLLMLFGGTVRQYGPYGNNNASPYWLWTACGARARGIAMTLYSLMSLKRQEQIEAMLWQ